MKRKGWWTAVVIGAVSLTAAAPKGTVPRSSAERYAVHAGRNGVGIGVVLLTPEQARRLFVSDVNHCCVVAEIALYPPKDKPLEVSLNDLVLRVNGTDIAAKPASAKLVAATLQKKAASTRDITVAPSVGVGYESGGYDPATGTQRSGGVYQQAGVGVGIGSSGPQSGSTDKDRAAMETELSEKGLPEGATSAPVAGFVYFPLASRKKNATLQLEYKANGEDVTLTLPR
ncbi:MAG: hypothetical protein WA628_14845 [Terriglobales bacterium]